MTLDVTAHGRSPNAIMHALAGKGAVTFLNGRVRGVDLAGVARTIQGALSGQAVSVQRLDRLHRNGRQLHDRQAA